MSKPTAALLRQLLELPVQDDAKREGLLALGLSPEELDNHMLLTVTLFQKAVQGADVSAMREIRGLLELERQEAEPDFSLPAHLLAAPFLEVYRDIRAKRHSEYVLRGGRGSTKSTFVSLVLLELLLQNPAMHAVVCRKVKDTIRDSVYHQMLWSIEALGLSEVFIGKLSPLEIECPSTGQKIFFRGADDPAKLKSIKPPHGYIGALWLEELDQFSGEEEVRSIAQSVLRGGEHAFVFQTFNPPKSIANWVNCRSPQDNRLEHHSTYLDVPSEWLGQKFLEDAELLREQNPDAYRHEYEGIAVGNGTNVFENLCLRPISEQEVDGFDRIYRGIDWGWYPDPFCYCAMHFQANERRLFLFDEISGTHLSNAEIADLLTEHGVTPMDRITADSGGEGPKSVADLKDRGFFMRRAKKGPGSVLYSMKWLAELKEIVIDPLRCPHAAKEFSQYEFERTAQGEILSGFPDRDNHSIDAVRYALEPVWRKAGR